MPTKRPPLPPTNKQKQEISLVRKAIIIGVAALLLVTLMLMIYATRVSSYGDFYPSPSDCTDALTSDPNTLLNGVEDATHYYYRNLSPRAQAVYDVLENGIYNFSPVVYLPEGTTQEDLRCATRFLMADNPDIFWFDGRGTVKKAHADGVEMFSYMDRDPSCELIAFSPLYLRDKDQTKAESDKYAEIADSFFKENSVYSLAQGHEDVSQREKLRLIFQYLADTLEYKHMAEDDQSIASALGSEESVCAGYSKAACFIARRNGIACIYIGGKAMNGIGGSNGNHAWIVALVDEKIIYCDPLWYDNTSSSKGFYDIKWFDTDKKQFNLYHHSHYPQLLPTIPNQDEDEEQENTD